MLFDFSVLWRLNSVLCLSRFPLSPTFSGFIYIWHEFRTHTPISAPPPHPPGDATNADRGEMHFSLYQNSFIYGIFQVKVTWFFVKSSWTIILRSKMTKNAPIFLNDTIIVMWIIIHETYKHIYLMKRVLCSRFFPVTPYYSFWILKSLHPG